MPRLAVGDKLPAFALPDHSGEKVSSASLLDGPVVIFCYPEANTPLCTKQACALSDAMGELARLGAKVVGLSPDTPEALAAFKRDQKLKLTLLGDRPGDDGVPRVMAALGAWGEKINYGRRYQGVLRTTLLVDASGVVRAVWPRVRVPGHAERVVNAVRALLAGPSPAVSRKAGAKRSARTGASAAKARRA